jgi:hypothetical protein
MVLTNDIPEPQCRRGTKAETDLVLALSDAVARYGITNVARATDTSVQSVAKAISGMRLYESTKRRLRSVLQKKVT